MPMPKSKNLQKIDKYINLNKNHVQNQIQFKQIILLFLLQICINFMGTTLCKNLFPCLYDNRINTKFNVLPEQTARPIKQPQNSQFIEISVACRSNCVIEYAGGIGSYSIYITALICEIDCGQQIQTADEIIYGISKNCNGEIFYKKRIFYHDNNIEEVIKKFAQKKILSELGVGEKISKLFDYDIQIYTKFIQYVAEVTIKKDALFNSNVSSAQVKQNKLQLKKYNLKQKKNTKTLSPYFKRFVFKYSELIERSKQNIEFTLQQQQIKKENQQKTDQRTNSFDQTLEKLIKLNQNSLNQLFRYNNGFSYQLNKLQNHIYLKNLETQKILREKIQKQILINLDQNDQKKYYKLLEHFYEKSNRTEDQLKILNHLIKLTNLTTQEKKRYNNKFNILQNRQEQIQKLINQNTPNYHLIPFYQRLAKIQLQKGNIYQALYNLQKSCYLQRDRSNETYIYAGTLLYQNKQVQKAKQFFMKGIKSGIKIKGKYYINNAKIYNLIGLLYEKQNKYTNALKAFQYCKKICNAKNIINDHYFFCLNNMVCLLQKMNNLPYAQAIYAQFQKQRHKMNHKQAIKIYSSMGNLQYTLNNLQEAKKMFGQCLKCFKSLVLLDPLTYIKVYTNLGCVQIRKKDYKKAEQYFEMGIQKQRKTDKTIYCFHLHNNLAMLYYLTGKIQKAMNEYNSILTYLMKLDSEQDKLKYLTREQLIHLYFNLALLYKRTHKPDKALLYLSQAEKISYLVYNSQNKVNERIKNEVQNIKAQRIPEESCQQDQSSTKNMSYKNGIQGKLKINPNSRDQQQDQQD